MRRQSGLGRLAAASVGLLVLAAAVSAQTWELRLADDTVLATDGVLINNPPALTRNLPVLFVHGHNPELLLSTEISDPHYKENWVDPLGTLPSFRETLNENAWMDIEEYYLRFFNQSRSITDDARDIRDAVNLILERHDPGFDHTNAASTTAVRVVIIAYSKGTISTRVYLKSLCVNDSRCQTHDPVPGLDPPLQTDFNPVSEFIAISPPNHGISTNVFAATDKLSVKQLYNGMRPEGGRDGFRTLTTHCTDSFGDAAATDYIQNLNGHPIADSIAVDPSEFYPSEAPGSRPPDSSPSTPGTLYVTLFASDNRDFVGGLTPSTDCPIPDGRKLARNLARDAINIPVSVSDHSDNLLLNGSPSAVHQNTVHTPEVICKALYAAVHHRSPSCAVCELNGGKPVIPQQVRAAAMLALDFSGSMSWPAGGGVTRADVLKDAVEVFLQVWSQFGVSTDRLGVTYFRTQVEPFQLPSTGELLPLFSAGHDAIRADVTRLDQLPRDNTAMGGALQRAITALRDPSIAAEVRRVILFTDGMQNVNPMVMRNANNQLVIVDEPGRQNSNISAASPPTVLDPALCIPVDTIGIGAGQAFVGLLEEIANETNGHTRTTLDMNRLREFFIEELIDALRGFSPQLVAYRRGAVAAKGITEAFAIEDGVSKLVLKLSWKRGDSLDFTVDKGGVDVTSAGRFIKGAFYKIFVIEFPAKGGITPRGNWQLRIKGNLATAYETAAIIDGGRIAYGAIFDATRPRVGDPLNLVVRLSADGKPMPHRSKVTVTLMSPRVAVGDIIATIRPKEFKGFEPGGTIAEHKMLALTQDARKLAALKPKRQTMVLKANDKGEFRTRFRPSIPGVYTAFVTIEGDDTKLGRFSRTQTVTTVVRSVPAKVKGRDVSASETAAGGGWRYVSLILSPSDAHGHRLGPGFSSDFSIQLSAGRKVGATYDLGDGRYMLVLARPPGDDPIIKLRVSGEQIFSGRLSELSGKPGR